MNRFPSPILRVSFEGPDVTEETLYTSSAPTVAYKTFPSPLLQPSQAVSVLHSDLQSPAIRRDRTHAIHGLAVQPSSSASAAKTILRTTYQAPVQAHVVRDYVTSHPRIFLPIFDPIRVLMVEGTLEGWFDIKRVPVASQHCLPKFSLSVTAASEGEATRAHAQEAWKERKDAESALESYLKDMPNTVAFVYGPQGSGKTSMISGLLKQSGRRALVIDVSELSKATSDAALLSSLARQTGYWPVFSVFNSLNNLVDLASVGLIGQKAGFSTTLTDQLKQILEVVGTGLGRVNTTHRKEHDRAVQNAHLAELRRAEEARVRERIREGAWHDGRVDCIAGNGVMSELGVGDEVFDRNDEGLHVVSALQRGDGEKAEKVEEKRGEGRERKEAQRKERSAGDVEAIEAMPIVIVKGFESKGGGASKEEMLDVLSRWAASLAQNQVAHVIIVSENRENAKRLTKALPSQPLNVITLSDADNSSALSFVKQKLQDSGVDARFSKEQVSYIQRLGGRASDLESLIHKVHNGQSVQDAIEDIVTRGVSEIRKNAYGEDLEDAKNLPWSREQAWAMMKKLSQKPEISYHDVLMDFPFKNDETALRHMEHAELIAIGTENARPSTIKPGKPVYRYVFERLVQDPVFRATQDIAFNERIIAASEGTVKSCEQELLTLKDVDAGTADWMGSRTAVRDRMNYLLKKMRLAGDKIEMLEKQNANLRKALSK
ncbi:RNA12 protein-domain-containing protein [Fomitopsis serialis]|uniref:RNA12 protein-domain-containing protein n=1 Tax=Fomitopsis serialis TaxID=139415 RepID=UPI002008C4DA|nr:RNA12 protein-domain-containing protein [Neoantrodia serialis]KAH9925242.1 RNA12 protein-domain-containing protein [Neoantrodia serialis]